MMVFAAAMVAGCSEYTKLLKSQDRDKMYTKALEYYANKKYHKAITLFGEVDPYTTGTEREDTVKFYTASAFYNMGDFETSGMLLDAFRRGSGRSSIFLEESEYLYAMGFYYSSPAPQRDQTASIQAIYSITEYLNRYPNSVKKEDMEGRIAELRNKLYDKEYINAKCYYTIGKYKAAVVSLKNVLDESPENPHREEMMYLTTKSGYLLAKNSIPDLQKDRYLKMMDYYINFMSEYPDSKYTKELNRMMDDAKKFLVSADKKEAKENKDNTTPENGSKES